MSDRRRLKIVNIKGLHARASAKLVELIDGFDATVTVSKDGDSVGGDSIMGLLMLAASEGSFIEVDCTGPQATEAGDAIERLVADKFGEGQ